MLSDFLGTTLYGNSVRDWLVALAIVAGSVIVSRVFYAISTKVVKRAFEKSRGKLMYIVIDMLEEPFAMLLIIIGFRYAQRMLSFPVTADAAIDKILLFVIILILTWALARLLDDLIGQYLVPIVEKSDSKLDDQLLPILKKTSSALVWVLGVIIALDNVGYNVGTIVAGLGIGGVAFAFAAQDTIANLFGGVTIFVDSQFVIGDRIKISGYDGWVREVGLRTTKLETVDGRRLTMPNSLFSKNVIENVSSEPATRVVETLGLACDQDSATIERALGAIKGAFAADESLEPKSTAWFQGFGDSSWDISLVIWVKKGADYAATLSRVNLAIVSAFEREGIKFSLPTTMVVKA